MATNQVASAEQSVKMALQAQTAGGQTAQQALEYLNQLKASPDAWRVCLDMFTRPTSSSSSEVRFFALQALDDLLKSNSRYKSLDQQAHSTLRMTLMQFCNQQYATEKSMPVFLKNKLAHAVVLLMVQQFPREWPTFFDEILLWAQSTGNESTELVDLFLRICLSIDEEVVCLYISRSDEETLRNTNIKNAMREDAVPKLVNAWLSILSRYYPANQKLAITSLKLLAIYINWIDISLVVNDTVIPALFEFLGDTALRNSAVECLTEIVGKGMKPLDKFQLIQSLRLFAVIEPMPLGNDSDFDDNIARLVDMTGESLCQVLTELPNLLDYINEDTDSRDDVCASLIPFSTAFLAVLKREKKKNTPLDYAGYLGHLLNVVFLKMKYAPTFVYGSNDSLAAAESMQSSMEFNKQQSSKGSLTDGIEEDEEEKAFLSRRNQMKILFENIYSIDAALVEQFVSSAVSQTIQLWDKCSSFADLELALHILYIYAESIKTTVFVDPKSSGQWTVLGHLIYLFFSTPELTSYPHPAIPLIYFETAVRYSSFFTVQSAPPDKPGVASLLPNVLSAFIGRCGAHHQLGSIQRRVWYLLNRFVRAIVSAGALKDKPGAPELVRNVVSALCDLSTITPESTMVKSPGKSPPPVVTDPNSVQPGSARNEMVLNVFEVIGLLASNLPENGGPVAEVLQMATAHTVDQMSSLMNEIISRKNSNSNDIESAVHTLSSCMQGLGALAKGFSDGAGKAFSCQQHPAATGILKRLLEINISVLEVLRDVEAIREGARYAFQRFYIILGAEAFPYLRPMISGFSHPSLTIKEITDIFPFLSTFLYKNRQEVLPVLDELLLPVIQKAFEFMGSGVVPAGEEGRQLIDLQRAYLQFLTNLFANDCDMVFLSPTNTPHLKAILDSLLHFAKSSRDGQVQKIAFNFMFRMLTSWYPGAAMSIASAAVNTQPSSSATTAKKPSAAAADSHKKSPHSASTTSAIIPKSNPIPPPPWLQQYIVSDLTVACWQTTLSPEFELDYLGSRLIAASNDRSAATAASPPALLQNQGDPQCLMVSNEIAMIIKAMTGLDPSFADLMINQQVLRQMVLSAAEQWRLVDSQRTRPVCEWIERESSSFWSSAKSMDSKQWKQFFKEFLKAIRLQFFTQAKQS